MSLGMDPGMGTPGIPGGTIGALTSEGGMDKTAESDGETVAPLGGLPGGAAEVDARGEQRWSCAGLSVNTLPPDGESHRYSVAQA